MSIIDQSKLASILNLPDNVYLLAYLCLGYVSEFPTPQLSHPIFLAHCQPPSVASIAVKELTKIYNLGVVNTS